MSRKTVISKFRTEQNSEKLKDRKVFKKLTLNFVHPCLFLILRHSFSCVEILFRLFYIFLNFVFLCFIMAKFGQIWLVARIASPPFFLRNESIFELARKRIGIGNLKSLLVPLFNSVITFLLEEGRTN